MNWLIKFNDIFNFILKKSWMTIQFFSKPLDVIDMHSYVEIEIGQIYFYLPCYFNKSKCGACVTVAHETEISNCPATEWIIELFYLPQKTKTTKKIASRHVKRSANRFVSVSFFHYYYHATWSTRKSPSIVENHSNSCEWNKISHTIANTCHSINFEENKALQINWNHLQFSMISLYSSTLIVIDYYFNDQHIYIYLVPKEIRSIVCMFVRNMINASSFTK